MALVSNLVAGASTSAACTLCQPGAYGAVPGTTFRCIDRPFWSSEWDTADHVCADWETVSFFFISGAVSSASCTLCIAGSFSTASGGLQRRNESKSGMLHIFYFECLSWVHFTLSSSTSALIVCLHDLELSASMWWIIECPFTLSRLGHTSFNAWQVSIVRRYIWAISYQWVGEKAMESLLIVINIFRSRRHFRDRARQPCLCVARIRTRPFNALKHSEPVLGLGPQWSIRTLSAVLWSIIIFQVLQTVQFALHVLLEVIAATWVSEIA